MSEMIERVARALHEAHKPWCDYTYLFEHVMSGREVYETLARAAIEAMREPTEEMALAVDSAWGNALESHWRRMIDAALTEKSP